MQRGIRLYWEIGNDGQVLTTPVQYVHYFDTEQFRAEMRGASVVLPPGTLLAYDLEFHQGLLGGIYIPFGSKTLPHGEPREIARVTSSMLEIRSVSTTPHRGVDFDTGGRPVLAMAGGEVIHAGYDCPHSQYVVVIRHHAAGFGLLSAYIHLQNLEVSVGAQVEQGRKIGTAVSHLHAEFRTFIDGQRARVYPFRWFVGNVPEYNGGLDFDFVQSPVADWNPMLGTFVTVTAYPRGYRDGPGLEVHMWWRVLGVPGWHQNRMVAIGNRTYRHSWSLSHPTAVEYWIQVNRVGVEVPELPDPIRDQYVTRPAQFVSAPPTMFYQVTVHPSPPPSPPPPPQWPPPGCGCLNFPLCGCPVMYTPPA